MTELPPPPIHTPRPWDYWMGPAIGSGIVAIYACAVAASFMWGSSDLQVTMTTSVIPLVSVVIGYYYGSSKGSAKKDDTLAAQLHPPVLKE